MKKQKKVAKKATEEVTTKEKLEQKLNYKATWRKICSEDKPFLMTMIGVTVASVLLLVVSLFCLRPQDLEIVTGYNDVYGEIAGMTGGYRQGSWMLMLTFPVLAIVFGALHNFLALRVYQKNGRIAAITILGITVLLIILALGTALKLAGEN